MRSFIPMLVAGVFVLSGCSETAGANQDDQSVESACRAVYAGLNDLYDSFNESEAVLAGDFTAALELATEKLDALDAGIQNQEVLDLWKPVSQAQREALAAAASGDEVASANALAVVTQKITDFELVCQVYSGE